MNKFGIKVYPSGASYNDGIHYSVNSINKDLFYNIRIINNKQFGIKLIKFKL